jgi:hypothetical protein
MAEDYRDFPVGERPDVEVLVARIWYSGELRAWSRPFPNAGGLWWGNADYRTGTGGRLGQRALMVLILAGRCARCVAAKNRPRRQRVKTLPMAGQPAPGRVRIGGQPRGPCIRGLGRWVFLQGFVAHGQERFPRRP